MLTIGMKAEEMHPTLADENHPLFLHIVKEELKTELAKLVDPEDPSAAYKAQQEARKNDFDYGGAGSVYHIAWIESPSDEVVRLYNQTIKSNDVRRNRLLDNLTNVEEGLRAAMSQTLLQKYKNMLL